MFGGAVQCREKPCLRDNNVCKNQREREEQPLKIGRSHYAAKLLPSRGFSLSESTWRADFVHILFVLIYDRINAKLVQFIFVEAK